MMKYLSVTLGLSLVSILAVAEHSVRYEVTITNITPGQTFTPQLVVTHPRDVRLFELGTPASEPLAIMAEGGDTGPLTDSVAGVATDAQTIGGLLAPGMSASVVVEGSARNGYLSAVAMLIPTNDTFFGLNGIPLPDRRSSEVTYLVPGYDAGSEVNDQSCQNMPGPRCPGGIGFSSEPGEGFVHIGNGFHELGEVDAAGFEVLGPRVYDWRNPVARITVTRLGK
jgi:Spondin_N